jgi:hypothetical protein
MEAAEPSILFAGPWGSGKTRLVAEKAYFLSCFYPGYKSSLVRKELKYLKRTTWKWLVDKVIPFKVLDASYYNKADLEIKLPNRSEILGCGLDEATKLASTEFGFIGVEEATEIIDEDSFNWIESRARDPNAIFHQTFYACNAGPPSHYLYKRFYLHEIGNGREEDRLIEGETLWDLLPESYKARLRMLKGRHRDRFILNKWVGYEGLVYDIFDPTKQVIDRFDIPSDWLYVIDVDFGYHAPFVCHLWAVSPDNVWYLDKEIYYTRRTVNQHAPTIKDLMEERNLIPGKKNVKREDPLNKGKVILRRFESYSDHDSEDQATLEEYGIATQNAIKDVSPGIQKVWDAMNDGRVFFFADALVERDFTLEAQNKPTCTVEELGGYVWQSGDKEAPKKENDHGCDGMRYGIFSHESGGAPGLFFA